MLTVNILVPRVTQLASTIEPLAGCVIVKGVVFIFKPAIVDDTTIDVTVTLVFTVSNLTDHLVLGAIVLTNVLALFIGVCGPSS